MAYNDSGAFVFKNGERRRDREDVGVFEDGNELPSEVRIYRNIAERLDKAAEGKEHEWWEHSHHAVLGDGDLRLCVYKSRPELFVRTWNWNRSQFEVTRVPLECALPSTDDHDDHGCEWSGSLNGFHFEVMEWQRPDLKYGHCTTLSLHLTEPDGSVWDSVGGAMYGAGHKDVMDAVDPREEFLKLAAEAYDRHGAVELEAALRADAAAVETAEILADPDTMAAIAEAEAETKDAIGSPVAQ